ncbi:MAG: efflux RND transporter periplasmic adaptor subunit [Planctomycetota bacterium]|nr:efflux RND transporter periplasmic adaptor subunit [Planctomycetota bacterium]
MSPMRLLYSILILSVLLTVGCQKNAQGSAAVGPKDRPATQVTTALVESRTLTSSIEFVGYFLPARRSVIVSEVDALVSDIPLSKQSIKVKSGHLSFEKTLVVGLGQKVEKGQVLVKLAERDFKQALALAKAQHMIATRSFELLKAWRRPEEIRRLRARLSASKTSLEQAKRDLDRAKELLRKNAFLTSDLERFQSKYQLASADFERATAELDIAVSGPTKAELAEAQSRLELAKIEVERRETALTKTKIRAPYTGVITDFYVEVGDRVTALPRVEVLEIMDVAVVALQANIPERYIHKIKVGEKAEVLDTTSSKPIPGVVLRVNQKVDFNTRAYRARVAVDNSSGRFKAGQFGRARFPFQSKASSVAIPGKAVIYESGEAHVFVVEKGVVTLARVELGLNEGDWVEIEKGLQVGQTVVIDDPSVLAVGMKVQSRKAKTAGKDKQ